MTVPEFKVHLSPGTITAKVRFATSEDLVEVMDALAAKKFCREETLVLEGSEITFEVLAALSNHQARRQINDTLRSCQRDGEITLLRSPGVYIIFAESLPPTTHDRVTAALNSLKETASLDFPESNRIDIQLNVRTPPDMDRTVKRAIKKALKAT